MLNKKLHGEIHTLVNNYGFIAIIKTLEVDAARRHLKWVNNFDNTRSSVKFREQRRLQDLGWRVAVVGTYPDVEADRLAKIRRDLSNCLRHLAEGA